MVEKTSSPTFKIDKIGLIKIGKGALVAIGGAGLVYIADIFIPALPDLVQSPYTPMIVAIASVIVNACRKFLVEYK